MSTRITIFDRIQPHIGGIKPKIDRAQVKPGRVLFAPSTAVADERHTPFWAMRPD